MSIKMAKNVSGNSGGGDGPAVSTGRRTPLSLGPNSGKSNRQQAADATGEIISNDNKQVPSKLVIDLTTESKNDSALTFSTENSSSKEKSGLKKQENGQDDKKSNGHKTEKSHESRQQKEPEINKAEIIHKPSNDIDTDIRLKPGPKSKKEKELKELKEKTLATVPPSRTTAKNETNSASSTPTKSTANENLSKSPSKRPQRSAAMAANASISSMAADASISSMAADKDLRGFGDEMRSLIYSDESQMSISGLNATAPKDSISTQMKTSTQSPTKVTSEKENEKKQIESVTEEKKKEFDKKHSTETLVKSSCIPVPITSTPEGKRIPLVRPPSSTLRQISARRSLHPSKDCSFQSQYRESYRKINTELDYTNSSLNVTVGSELNANDSASSSFFFWGRGRKRERTPPPTSSSATDILSVDSPKRARLDFSGFLGLVASPVTMLRAKLARTKIEVDINDVDGVENLDEINSAELRDSFLKDKENSNKVGNEESDLSCKDNDEEIDIEVINEKSLKNSSEVDDEDINESNDNIELNDAELPKRRCNIM